jgi:drug/metabolite transporter, DME family
VLLTGLLSGLTYGLCSIFGKLLSRHLSPVTILSYALGIGAALLLVAALPTLRALAGLSFGSYALLFILAVVHTALAFRLYTAGLKRLDAGQAAIVATVEPVAAGAIGVALFGEEISAPKLLGGALGARGRGAGPGVMLEKASRRAAASEAPSRPR